MPSESVDSLVRDIELALQTMNVLAAILKLLLKGLKSPTKELKLFFFFLPVYVAIAVLHFRLERFNRLCLRFMLELV